MQTKLLQYNECSKELKSYKFAKNYEGCIMIYNNITVPRIFVPITFVISFIIFYARLDITTFEHA